MHLQCCRKHGEHIRKRTRRTRRTARFYHGLSFFTCISAFHSKATNRNHHESQKPINARCAAAWCSPPQGSSLKSPSAMTCKASDSQDFLWHKNGNGRDLNLTCQSDQLGTEAWDSMRMHEAIFFDDMCPSTIAKTRLSNQNVKPNIERIRHMQKTCVARRYIYIYIYMIYTFFRQGLFKQRATTPREDIYDWWQSFLHSA